MRCFTAEAMRELDRRTIDSGIISGIELMEQAGRGLYREVLNFSRRMIEPDFLLLAGKGNNGGDVLILARLLAESHRRFRLRLTSDASELSGDAAEAFRKLPEEWKKNVGFSLTRSDLYPGTVVIDGLLGTGVRGEVRDPAASWIRLVNRSGLPVVAVDIPSGMNGTDGSGGLCLRADLTVTMAGVKTGMMLRPAPCGRIAVVRIGIPESFLEEAASGPELFGREEAAALLKREPFDTYKNKRGSLLVLGGSRDYPSAPFLTAEAGLRCGAGLVTVALKSDAGIFCTVPRALIVRKLPVETYAAEAEKLFAGKQALAIGPGLGQGGELLVTAAAGSGIPAVLDADALNALASSPEAIIDSSVKPLILTPHAGEMARLMTAFGIKETVREKQALALAEKTGSVVVLKGPHSVVASPDGGVSLNLSGTPALATAGSGDVLTGICGAFLANGMAPFDAARLGTYLHGAAGEYLVPSGSRGIIADDLLSALPAIL